MPEIPTQLQYIVDAHRRSLDLFEQAKRLGDERNRMVARAVAEGERVAAIAAALGVERQRVYQLLEAGRRREAE